MRVTGRKGKKRRKEPYPTEEEEEKKRKEEEEENRESGIFAKICRKKNGKDEK